MSDDRRAASDEDCAMSDAKPGFLARYKRWIIAFLLIWALMLGILILSGDGGNLPFQYQVF